MAIKLRNINMVLATLVALLLLSANVNAVPVTIEVIGANWSNVKGGTNLKYLDENKISGNESIRWGSPATAGGQSGYSFAGAAPPAFTVETGTVFGLGKLTHYNYPIYSGGGISGATLDVFAKLTVEGKSIKEGPFSFSLFHNETPNNCTPQPTCANDIVTFANNIENTDTFESNGKEYTFKISSFLFKGETAKSFSSPESQANTALLQASIESVPTASVPEPSSMLLLGLGVTALAVTRKRKKSAHLPT